MEYIQFVTVSVVVIAFMIGMIVDEWHIKNRLRRILNKWV